MSAPINYYLVVFPTEALIASQLDPDAFGCYMAVGPRRGNAERLAFIELKAPFGDDFDWAHAIANCKEHPDGRLKNSVYLSVYRVLEHVPVSAMGDLYLVTASGVSLRLTQAAVPMQDDEKRIFLYQEFCPVRSLVMSGMDPAAFAKEITSARKKIHFPRIIFADLKVIDLDHLDTAGNIGSLYYDNLEHLRNCMEGLGSRPDKMSKTIDRSHAESFTYQLIDTGIYVGDRHHVAYYRMPGELELRMHHYRWTKSAMII